MKEKEKKLVLNTINNTGSIMSMLVVGYSYFSILKLVKHLEDEGLINWDTDKGIRILTKKGIAELIRLNEKSETTSELINPLSQYKTERLGIEEIFLP